MKKTTLLWVALAAAIVMASCSKNDDAVSTDNQTSETAVKAAFGTQFPSASNVSWTSVDGFQVASFTLSSSIKATANGQYKCSAWYKGNGKWEMTEIEYTSEQLPDTVKKAFQATEYGNGSWTVVKIVRLKKADGTEHYKFELSKAGQNNVFLYFDVTGKLLKVKEKNKNYSDCINYPNVVPDTLKAIILKLYPNGVIKEVMQGPWGYWVELKDGNNEHNLFYNKKYELLMSMSKLTLEGLPKAVQDAFAASSYASWSVEGIKAFIMKDMPSMYMLMVKKDGKYMVLMYGADGKPFQGPNSYGY